MLIQNEMPIVEGCAAAACAYNAEGGCHARAITIGNGIHPDCDTFFAKKRNAIDTSIRAGVGACKVEDCRHNEGLECAAPAIRIADRSRMPDCATYEARSA